MLAAVMVVRGGAGRPGIPGYAELRRLLGVLNDAPAERPGRDHAADERAPEAPQPSIATLDRLASTVRTAGLDIDLAITGAVRPLPPRLELSVYRIVQEALTNVLRHARASRAEVRVGYGPDTVTIDVVDDGTARTASGVPAGHGLVGMRQRARSSAAPPRPALRQAVAGRCAPSCRPNPSAAK